MKYTVIYEKSATGYGAYVPDLPGCVATGKTKAQVKRLMREAIELHIESLKQHGEPVPEPTTVADFITVSA
ncbi:MAG TPA: type II toxin-antitoxin system HicB family antitoxin [Terracidiphilus sp.]|jgi:predicted RNase H-like HicB family nuclease|nr:type II toxin-antitoxin system HicB family antitoxin [Terracidiphilus sp.]